MRGASDAPQAAWSSYWVKSEITEKKGSNIKVAALQFLFFLLLTAFEVSRQIHWLSYNERKDIDKNNELHNPLKGAGTKKGCGAQ